MSKTTKKSSILPTEKWAPIDFLRFGFLLFLLCSFAGWVYEVLVYYFEFGCGFVNRGYLFGPYLPVYGTGSLLIILALWKFKEKKISFLGISITPVICFVLAVIIATVTELVTSYLMEMVMGKWLWDYTRDIPNFQGRIALKSSLRFGILSMVGLYLVCPLMLRLDRKARANSPKVYRLVVLLLFALFMADVIARFFVGSNYNGPIL